MQGHNLSLDLKGQATSETQDSKMLNVEAKYISGVTPQASVSFQYDWICLRKGPAILLFFLTSEIVVSSELSVKAVVTKTFKFLINNERATVKWFYFYVAITKQLLSLLITSWKRKASFLTWKFWTRQNTVWLYCWVLSDCSEAQMPGGKQSSAKTIGNTYITQCCLRDVFSEKLFLVVQNDSYLPVQIIRIRFLFWFHPREVRICSSVMCLF